MRVHRITASSRSGLGSAFASQHTVRADLVKKQVLCQLSDVPVFYLSKRQTIVWHTAPAAHNSTEPPRTEAG
jgi:hypothetical protein